MKILGIIPARSGSKEIPCKNIKPLAGKPLIAWTIEEAKKSKYIDRLIVSTNDKEIASVAKKYGCEVPFIRPKEISGDLATDVEFIEHALDWFEENETWKPDIILRLPPTAPLRTYKHIDEGIEVLIKDENADASRPITEAQKHPFKMWVIPNSSDYLEPFLDKSITGFDEPHNLPRQLFPKVYIHTGAMDVIRYDTIKKLKSTSGKKLRYFYMKPEDSINIDHLIDFEVAEILMSKRKEK